MRRTFRLAPLLLALACGWCAVAANAAPEPPPEFRQRWRYVRMPGLDVLSNCNDAKTTAYLQRAYRALSLLDLPREFAAPRGLPLHLVLDDFGLEAELTPRDAPGELQNMRNGRGAIDYCMALDVDACTMRVNLRRWRIDSGMDVVGLPLRLVPFIVAHRSPPPPAWLVAGLKVLYDEGEGTVTIDGGKLSWPAPEAFREIKDAVKRPENLLPLSELLGERPPPSDPAARRRWQVQAALFVRWGLNGARSRPEQFWQFCARACEEPVTEALFEAHFRLGLEAGRRRLSEHLTVALRDATEHFATEVPPPKLELRDATRAEICRIHGGWLDFVASSLDDLQPALARIYRERAGRLFAHAYDAGDRDPALLAELGLHHVAAGETVLARRFLEDAAQRAGIRSLALRELARLRLAEARSSPRGPANRLHEEQLHAVLQPLRVTRLLAPASADTYRLLIQAWDAAATPPTAEQWAELAEGLQRFPRNCALALELARLRQRSGSTAEAAAIAHHALRFEPDAATRAALHALIGPDAPALRAPETVAPKP